MAEFGPRLIPDRFHLAFQTDLARFRKPRKSTCVSIAPSRAGRLAMIAAKRPAAVPVPTRGQTQDLLCRHHGGSGTGRARPCPWKGHSPEQSCRLTRRGRHLASTFPVNLQPVSMIIQRRKGLTQQPTGQTRDRIAQIKLRLMRILPKQAGQVIFEVRVRQTNPTTSPLSGQIPRFFSGFRHITKTHAIRNQKNTRF